jgi:hypothetical protein
LDAADADGRTTRYDVDVVADWLGRGAGVLAVVDGVVVATCDDVPESDTVSGHPKLTLADSTGNVTLEHGGGRCTSCERLRPGRTLPAW